MLTFIHMPLTWGWLEPRETLGPPGTPSLTPTGQPNSTWLSGKHTHLASGALAVCCDPAPSRTSRNGLFGPSAPQEGAFSFSLETALKEGSSPKPRFYWSANSLQKVCEGTAQTSDFSVGLFWDPIMRESEGGRESFAGGSHIPCCAQGLTCIYLGLLS